MKAKLIWTLVIVAVVAIFGGRAWYLYQHPETDTNMVKIGVLLPLTGPVARDGEDVLKGLKIAEKDINENTKYNHKLKLVVEDNKFTPQGALSAYYKIGDVSAFIIGGTYSLSIFPLLEKEHKPALAILWSEEEPAFKNPEVFISWITANTQANAVADYLLKEHKGDKIAFLRVISQDGTDFENTINKRFSEVNEPIFMMERYSLTALDTKPEIYKILAKNPDVIYVYGYGQGYTSALNALLEQRYPGKVITSQDVQMNHRHVTNNGAGMYFLTMDYDYQKLTKNSPELEGNLFAAFGYEALNLLADAVQEVGNDSQKITEWLGQTHNHKTRFISYDKQGKLYLPPFVLKQMQPDGTAKVIKE